MRKIFLLSCCAIFISGHAHAINLIGRLGVGMSNQLILGAPAISAKIQRSRSFALGALLALDANSDGTSYGAGLRGYRIIYDEPNLNFFMGGLVALLQKETTLRNDSGYQGDLTLGSEFHFTGIESIGFSFEFGLSVQKLEGPMTIKTTGSSFVVAGIHFYL